MEQLNIGIIGSGKFAQHHIKIWQCIDYINNIFVFGHNQERLDVISQKTNCVVHTDFDCFLNSVDVVDIVSINCKHAEYAKKSLQKQKHVIVEKPLATSIEGGKEILKEKKTGRAGTVVSQYRYNPTYRKVKGIIENGRLGKIKKCYVYNNWRRNAQYYKASSGWRAQKEKAGGGVLIHQGIHFIDLMCWFFGKPLSVYGKCDLNEQTEFRTVEKSFSGIITFQKNIDCQFSFTLDPYVSNWTEAGFFFEKGKLLIMGRHLFVFEKDRLIASSFRNISEIFFKTIKKRLNEADLIRIQFENFCKAVLDGRDPDISLDDGMTALKTICQLYESAQTGKNISLF